MDIGAQIVETWRINDRLNHYLLASLSDDLLATPLAKGKKVGAQLAHIHNVRLMWLKVAAPDLWEPMQKIEEPNSVGGSGGGTQGVERSGRGAFYAGASDGRSDQELQASRDGVSGLPHRPRGESPGACRAGFAASGDSAGRQGWLWALGVGGALMLTAIPAGLEHVMNVDPEILGGRALLQRDSGSAGDGRRQSCRGASAWSAF